MNPLSNINNRKSLHSRILKLTHDLRSASGPYLKAFLRQEIKKLKVDIDLLSNVNNNRKKIAK